VQGGEIDEVLRLNKHNKSKVRARVENVSAVVKRLWGEPVDWLSLQRSTMDRHFLHFPNHRGYLATEDSRLIRVCAAILANWYAFFFVSCRHSHVGGDIDFEAMRLRLNFCSSRS
jgi:hypothetical protein